MIVRGFRVGPLVRKTGSEVLEDGVLNLAAENAYYFFFSIFPLFLFAAPLISLIAPKQRIFGWVMGQLATSVPNDALAVVRGVVKDVVFSPSAPGLLSVGALLSAWAGTNVFGSLMRALNTAYDVTETRPWWKQKLIALLAVAGSGVLLMVSSAIFLGGPEVARWLGARTGAAAMFSTAWLGFQYALAFGFLVLMMWLIYFFLPNQRQSARQILVGAVVAAVLWIVGTLAFRLYVGHFGSYNKTYGTIGGVIVLLTWMYLTMLVILVGGELNSELHHGTGSVDPRARSMRDES